MNALQTWKIWVLTAILSCGILTASVAMMPQIATATEGEAPASASSTGTESAPTTKDESSSSATAESSSASSASEKAEKSESSSSKEAKAPVSSSTSEQLVEGSPLIVDKKMVIEESQVWTGGMVRIVGTGSIVIPEGVELTLDSVTVDLSGFDAEGYSFEVGAGGKLILAGTSKISGFKAEAEAEDNDTEEGAEPTAIVKVAKKGTLVLADDLAIVDNEATAENSSLVENAGELDVVGDNILLASKVLDPKGETTTLDIDGLIEDLSENGEGEVAKLTMMPMMLGATPAHADENDGSSSSSSSSRATDTVDLAVSVQWLDSSNADKKRPAEAVLTLATVTKDSSGKETKEAVKDESGNAYVLTLSEAGQWKGNFTNMPRYDADGNAISYSVIENEIDGYYANISTAVNAAGTGYDITVRNVHGSSSVNTSVSTITRTGTTNGVTTSGTTTTGKALAATGDSVNFLLVAGLLVGSMMAAGLALNRRREE